MKNYLLIFTVLQMFGCGGQASLTVHTIVDTTSVNWKPKLAYKSWKLVLPKHLQ